MTMGKKVTFDIKCSKTVTVEVSAATGYKVPTDLTSFVEFVSRIREHPERLIEDDEDAMYVVKDVWAGEYEIVNMVCFNTDGESGMKMSDMQWVPEVGERCDVVHGYGWHEALYLGKDIYGNHAYQIAAGEFKGEFNGTPDVSEFRPAPTDEELAIEEMARIYRNANSVLYADSMREVYNAIRDGKIIGVSLHKEQPVEDMNDLVNWQKGI